jgi:alkane 1-monooxygenase
MQSDAFEDMPSPWKYRHTALCFLPHMPFILLALGAFLGGRWLVLPSVFMLGVLPLLDHVTGWQSNRRFHKRDFSSLNRALLHWNTRLYVIFYIVAVLWFAHEAARSTPTELILLVLCLAVVGGIGFSAAHEMLHRREDRIDQLVQRVATAFLFYPHYKMIHVRSHHPLVATDDDKNTAWMNESVYAYFIRTIPASMLRCWQLEAGRVKKRGGTVWRRTVRNQMVVFVLGQAVLAAAMALFAGPQGLLFYFAQLVGAHVVLESVNYIQHYGLMRKQADGRYERTDAEHSWDTYHYFSSYATFRVGHHSSHHVSLKPYYLLDAEPSALKLPVGYFWALPLVLIPPLWRHVINPRLSQDTIQASPA